MVYPITLSEPKVKLQVVDKSITFLLDIEATYSVLTSHSGLMFPSPISVMGVDGTRSSPLKTLSLPCILGGHFFPFFLSDTSLPSTFTGSRYP